jgi:hypothetical protein
MEYILMKIFLDDIRNNDEGTVLVRNVPDLIKLIEENGFPSYISFDHDLGLGELTGHDFAKILVDKVLDGHWIIPDDFTFSVHSDNPVGAENIRGVINSFLKFKGFKFQLKKCEPYSSRT